MDNSNAPFPGLRYAYLRAIARAWNDSQFLDELVAAGDDGLQFLEELYNFKFRYDVIFRMSADAKRRPNWDPNVYSGWWGSGDLFKMSLPGKPKRDVQQSQYADILTRYLAEFPTMLGKRILDLGVSAADETPKRFVPGAPPSFAEFGIVTGRIIAATWRNRAYGELCFNASPAQTVQVINNSMDYTYPWNFAMKFEQHDPAPSPDDEAEFEEYWATFPRTKIVVHIPYPPTTEQDGKRVPHPAVQPVALAAYNGTGVQYPFTCP